MNVRIVLAVALPLACWNPLHVSAAEVQAQTKTKATVKPPHPSSREELEKRTKELIAESSKLYFADKASEAIKLDKEIAELQQLLFPKEQFPHGHVDIASSLFRMGLCYGELGDVA